VAGSPGPITKEHLLAV
jgi:hypothetical protein